jgi:hypothetical protein
MEAGASTSTSQAGVSAGGVTLTKCGARGIDIDRTTKYNCSQFADLHGWRPENRPQTPPPGKWSFPPNRVPKPELGNESAIARAGENLAQAKVPLA